MDSAYFSNRLPKIWHNPVRPYFKNPFKYRYFRRTAYVEKNERSLIYVPTISMIENMDNTAAEIASGFYLEELKKHIEVGKKQIVIDKLPLNILQIPLIN